METKRPYTAPPVPSTSSQVQTEAPSLLGLFESLPTIHIYTISHPSFQEFCILTDASVPSQPSAVIRPISEFEVSATISFCATHSVPAVIRSGGNDIGGRSRPSSGSVMIDMRSLDSIAVFPNTKTATLGGGVLCGPLLQFLDSHGLATPTAFVGAVGYTAWACGGGYGVLCGTMGLGADQILGGRVVMASGEVVDSNQDEHLFWALRGAGAGVLGVITELRIRVHPRPKCVAGFVVFPFAEAVHVLEGLEALYTSVGGMPDQFAGEMLVLSPPGSEDLMNLFYVWTLKEDGSDIEESWKFLKAVEGLGTVVTNTVNEMTPWEFMRLFPNPKVSTPAALSVKSCCVRNWSAELAQILTQTPLPSKTSSIVIHTCHGRSASSYPESCFWNREPHILFGFVGSAPVDDTELSRQTKTWSTKLSEDVSKVGLAMGSEYINFTAPLKGDGVLFYGADGAKRLKMLKERYDPSGFFAQNTPDLETPQR